MSELYGNVQYLIVFDQPYNLKVKNGELYLR